MDKCPKCGNRLSRSDILCTRCGAMVDNLNLEFGKQTPPSKPSDVQRAPEADMQTSEQDKKELGQGLSSYPEASFEELPKESGEEILPSQDDIFISYSPPVIPPEDPKDSAEQNDKKFLEISEVEGGVSPSASASESAEETQSLPETKENNPKDEPEDDYVQKPEKRPVLLTAFFWLLLGVALFVGFFLLNRHVMSAYGSYPSFVFEITGGRINLDTEAMVQNSITIDVSEAKTEDGQPAHRFVISSIGGTSVRLLPLGSVFAMEDGRADFVVSDEDFAKALGVVSYKDSYEVEDASALISVYSQDYTRSIEPFMLSLMDADYVRSAPEQSAASTFDQSVTISISVKPDATVYINNEIQTDQLDETGHLSVSLPLVPGENPFTVDVVQPGRKSVRESFSIVRELREIALKPGTAFLQVFEDTFECGGTTEPGATVTATIGENVFTSKAEANGKFTIECKLSDYGFYKIALKATAENMKEGQAIIEAERLPKQSTFIKGAKKTDPAELISKFDSLAGKAIQTTGRIEALYNDAHTTTFVLISGIDRLECVYYGTTKLTAGKSYKLYGMPLAENNTFYVMFVG